MQFATANENTFCTNTGVIIEPGFMQWEPGFKRRKPTGPLKRGCLMFADGPCCSWEI